ncbi:MAG: deiodinase-like protein [Chthoniobacterales bacterium]
MTLLPLSTKTEPPRTIFVQGSSGHLRCFKCLMGRGRTALGWYSQRAWRSLRKRVACGSRTADPRAVCYNDLYRGIGERALQSGLPGERVPELTLYDLQGHPQLLSSSWEKRPALLVTMSLSCGRTRRNACALRRLARRFERHINTVVIYVVEAHPTNAPSPYTEALWMTPKNEMAGIYCVQPQTLEQRIDHARQLQRRFRFSNSMLIDALDNRGWQTFGSAPNVAMLIRPDGRIANKQGWFAPKAMTSVITALLKNPATAANPKTSLGD